MKTLIVYESGTGTTAKCARKIASQFEHVKLVDVAHVKFELSTFDTIIIGSNTRDNHMAKSIKDFIAKNRPLLLTKNLAFYVCCAFFDLALKNMTRDIPKDLLEHALVYDYFGGELVPENVPLPSKEEAKKILKEIGGRWSVALLPERIDRFVTTLKLEGVV